jgi:hypothetical protein
VTTEIGVFGLMDWIMGQSNVSAGAVETAISDANMMKAMCFFLITAC